MQTSDDCVASITSEGAPWTLVAIFFVETDVKRPSIRKNMFDVFKDQGIKLKVCEKLCLICNTRVEKISKKLTFCFKGCALIKT